MSPKSKKKLFALIALAILGVLVIAGAAELAHSMRELTPTKTGP